MAKELPANIWFVRSNGGSGSYPVKPEGWRVTWIFMAGVGLSIFLAALLASMASSTWIWVAVFAVGMAASAWYYIGTARKHTDYSITYNEYMADRGSGG
jgi:peptidoglycan/LPS O-acetylase OafA/YrhL